MKVGDILYFAPQIKFSEVNIDGPDLPEQFRQRMDGFYIIPSEICADHCHPFASGVLVVTCIDAMARIRFGNGVRKRFLRFAGEELDSFSGVCIAERFYDEVRNGLVHEGRLKNGAQFSIEVENTVQLLDGILVVNPKRLAQEVRSALDSYVTILKNNKSDRQKLASFLKRDLVKDFQAAQTL